MAKIAVLGAGGFIGSNLVAFLKDKGYWVRAVDKAFPKDRLPNITHANEVMYLNLLDIKSCILATRDVDWVIHLSADMGGVGYFTTHDYQPFLNNMQMSMNILQACDFNHITRMFYSSSFCIYPTHLQMDVTNVPKLAEDMVMPANADQMYGWEKLMTLQLCRRAPLDARVGIFGTIYGPYQEISGERMKFPTAIATKTIHAKEINAPVEVWGDGKQIRTFLYIDDAVAMIHEVLASDSYWGPVNIASTEEVSVEQIALLCCDLVGLHPELHFNHEKPSGVLARGADMTKFNNHYQFRPQVDTKEGFKRLIEWIQHEKSQNNLITGR